MIDLPFKIPESKTEMFDLIHSTRTELTKMWQGLSEAQMLQVPGPQEDWSVKDMIAHLTWWENYMMLQILLVKAGQKVAGVKDYNAVNAQVYQVNKELTLAQVLADFKQSLPRVIALLERLTWEEINGGLDYRGDSILRFVGGDTFGHYYEHMEDLKQFIS